MSTTPHEHGVDARLAAAVARRYHLAGESKVEIARSLDISRFKVARLLDQAHHLGLVTVTVRDPDDVADPLAEAITQRFELTECVVVRGVGHDDPGPLVGTAAAGVLERVVRPDEVLGLPWARAVHHAILRLHELPAVEVIQLCGSLVTPGQDTPYDVVRQVGRLTGGPTLWYQAPLIMPTAEGATSLRAHQDIARARGAIERVTVALCSIGAWRQGGSTVHDAVAPEEQAAIRAEGVVGESMGVLFAADGTARHVGLSDRLIAPSHEQMAAIPNVVAMARGADRVEATRAALRGGLVRRLVVDEELAKLLAT